MNEPAISQLCCLKLENIRLLSSYCSCKELRQGLGSVIPGQNVHAHFDVANGLYCPCEFCDQCSWGCSFLNCSCFTKTVVFLWANNNLGQPQLHCTTWDAGNGTWDAGQVFIVKCTMWKSQRKCWVANYVCFIGRKRLWFGIGWAASTPLKKKKTLMGQF